MEHKVVVLGDTSRAEAPGFDAKYGQTLHLPTISPQPMMMKIEAQINE